MWKKKERNPAKGRDGHEGVELLHLVAEKGGKRGPFVGLFGKGKLRSRERGNARGDWRSKRRGEVLWDREGAGNEAEGGRESKEGLGEGQTGTEKEEERCDEEKATGVYRLIDSRGFVPPSLPFPLSFPLSLPSPLAFHFVARASAVCVCLCAFKEHVSEVTQTEWLIH